MCSGSTDGTPTKLVSLLSAWEKNSSVIYATADESPCSCCSLYLLQRSTAVSTRYSTATFFRRLFIRRAK